MIRTRRFALPLIAVALVAAITGCFNPFQPLVSNISTPPSPPPSPTSPGGLLLLFQWAYQNRDIVNYKELFTADYQFAFSATDSAGNNYRSNPWIRDDELASAGHLFNGGLASEPPASNITLVYSGKLLPQPDLRPGKTYPWHQTIQIQVVLTVQKTDGAGYQVQGGALFYLVRGDSANIPPDLIAQGFGPDPNRWYIERWEDQTNSGASPAALRHPPPGALEVNAAAAPVAAFPWRQAAAGVTTVPTHASWGFVKTVWR